MTATATVNARHAHASASVTLGRRQRTGGPSALKCGQSRNQGETASCPRNSTARFRPGQRRVVGEVAVLCKAVGSGFVRSSPGTCHQSASPWLLLPSFVDLSPGVGVQEVPSRARPAHPSWPQGVPGHRAPVPPITPGQFVQRGVDDAVLGDDMACVWVGWSRQYGQQAQLDGDARRDRDDTAAVASPLLGECLLCGQFRRRRPAARARRSPRCSSRS